jgi:hypothetical protein
MADKRMLWEETILKHMFNWRRLDFRPIPSAKTAGTANQPLANEQTDRTRRSSAGTGRRWINV